MRSHVRDVSHREIVETTQLCLGKPKASSFVSAPVRSGLKVRL